MWEYLSLYAERDNDKETFTVKHYPERGNKIAEGALLNQLGLEGWELVAVVPAYSKGTYDSLHHQLYLKRPLATSGRPTTRFDTSRG
jgi:hypothetical protein